MTNDETIIHKFDKENTNQSGFALGLVFVFYGCFV
nr:MAG TPA: hypothetical protein [Caudoviricetes sp.]